MVTADFKLYVYDKCLAKRRRGVMNEKNLLFSLTCGIFIRAKLNGSHVIDEMFSCSGFNLFSFIHRFLNEGRQRHIIFPDFTR